MRVILTHENTDFDAVASQLAAWKLDPTAFPVLPQRLNRNVRAFLAQHASSLPHQHRADLKRRKISHALVVDTQRAQRVRGMTATTPVHIIDHHPRLDDLPANTTFEGEQLGANTTLLVEKFGNEISVTPLEATLLLLGIYEDTGTLTFSSTTARDAQAVAWLLARGADLDMARSFLRLPLTRAQRDLLAQLARQSETHSYGPFTVTIATATAPRPVDEISTLAHRLVDAAEPDALFLLVAMEDRVHLVARSRGKVDVGDVARRLGGGGHSRAAAALVRDAELRVVYDRLLDSLADLAPPPTVGSIMSRGAVRTLPPTATVAEAADLMRRFGHEGYPVVEEGRVVGVIARRDIDLATRHGLDTAPISAYMVKGPVQVAPTASLADLQRLMLDLYVGQVPVVEHGELVGIVTRTDLIKHHAGDLSLPSPNADLAQRFEARLTEPALDLIHQASQAASDLGLGLYVVGGFVRDLLLNAPRVATDIDLVVEGNAHMLVQTLVQRHGGVARYHRAFGTAHWTPARTDQLGLDFVTARTEFYTEPTALPTVEASSIKLDLHRRDFSINTLALALNPERYGQLLDFYGGQADLARRLVRVLHSLSFVEDPTRILRAARLEQRLDFAIEPRTLELVADAVHLLRRTSGDRIRHEVYRLLEEPRDVPSRSLRRLDELGVLQTLQPQWRWTPVIDARLATARVEPGCQAPPADEPSLVIESLYAAATQPAPNALALVVYDLDRATVDAVAHTLKLSRADTRLLHEVIALKALKPRLLSSSLAPSALVDMLDPFSDTALCLFRIAEPDPPLRAVVDRYRQVLSRVHPTITGDDLRALGLPPGPAYREILTSLRAARLDGEIIDDDAERALAKQLVENAFREDTRG